MRTDCTDGSRWLPALAVVVAIVVFGYPLLLGTPLLDPDEGIHASIAQEMVERGNWVTPSLLDEPFLDKPIAYSWAQAVSLRLLGMNEAAARLPGLILSLPAYLGENRPAIPSREHHVEDNQVVSARSS